MYDRPSLSKRGRGVRLQRPPDAPRIKSAVGLSFLKPTPRSEEGQCACEEKAVELDQVVKLNTRAEEPCQDPSANLGPHLTRGKLLPPGVLTEVEVRALIGACSTRGLTGHRNRALIAILWRTGIRISEALERRPHGVDFQNGTVRVRLGKGLRPRTTALSDLDALPLVERCLEEWGS